MILHAIFLIVFLLLCVLLVAYPLGFYVAKVGLGHRIRGLNGIQKIEEFVYRLAGIAIDDSMDWKKYSLSMIIFNIIGILFVYFVQRFQNWLPLNPQHFTKVAPDLSFNTAVSFVTNTNWQAYGGESTMSYLTQMLALTGQNFFSAATSIAVLFALIRSFSANSLKTIGNFWIDLTRSTLYILLPLATVLAIILLSQGVIQNFSAYKKAHLVDKMPHEVLQHNYPKLNQQIIAMGPVASQEAIKILGSNGGGFFKANSAHPFENPSPLSNLIQIFSILLLPVSLCFAFGVMVKDMRQAWTLLGTMIIIFLFLSLSLLHFEQQNLMSLSELGIDQTVSTLQAGGNMEGKESRFGINGSAFFAAVNTAVSCGAVNSMHDSYTPLGGMILLVFIQLGGVIFGGVGNGLYSMLILAMVAVFIAGLMIGRTPEYLGKKIQIFEMKMISLTILIIPFLVLVGTVIAIFVMGKEGLLNPGPHGFTEMLYAFSSTANNNGSAFDGLSANKPFYNIMLAVVMWLGRFGVMIPVLAIAGSLANKKYLTPHLGTLPTYGFLFISLLIGVILLIGVLNYLPALVLGPIIEQLRLS